MPMALSRLFIQKTFVDNIRVEAQQMIDNIREAMLNRIPKMKWLDEETKQYAITKVLKMKDRIGFPSDIMNIKKYYVYKNNYYQFFINIFQLKKYYKNRYNSYTYKIKDILVNVNGKVIIIKIKK